MADAGLYEVGLDALDFGATPDLYLQATTPRRQG
jgi:hypothetical protein